MIDGTYGLRSMVSMTVNVKVIFGVGHVLRSINLVELSLAVLNLPQVACSVFAVLAEVSTEQWCVVSSNKSVKSCLIDLSK